MNNIFSDKNSVYSNKKGLPELEVLEALNSLEKKSNI